MDNPVLHLLKETKEIYSFRSLKKKLRLNRHQLGEYLNDPSIIHASPFEVGSGKAWLNIWKYNNEECETNEQVVSPKRYLFF